MQPEQVQALLQQIDAIPAKFFIIQVYDVAQSKFIGSVEVNETSNKQGYVLSGSVIEFDGTVKLFQYILKRTGEYYRNYKTKQL